MVLFLFNDRFPNLGCPRIEVWPLLPRHLRTSPAIEETDRSDDNAEYIKNRVHVMRVHVMRVHVMRVHVMRGYA